MAVATAEMPEPIPDRGDVGKIARIWALEKIAHTGMMLEKILRQNQRAAQYEKFAVSADPKDLLDAPESEADVGVNIGNEIHYHNVQPPTPEAATATQPTAPTVPTAATPETPANPTTATPAAPAQPLRQRVRRRLSSFVIPVLLGAGSLGAGAAGMAVYNYMTDKPDSVTTITQPGGKFEYRYGIEQRPTPQ